MYFTVISYKHPPVYVRNANETVGVSVSIMFALNSYDVISVSSIGSKHAYCKHTMVHQKLVWFAQMHIASGEVWISASNNALNTLNQSIFG